MKLLFSSLKDKENRKLFGASVLFLLFMGLALISVIHGFQNNESWRIALGGMGIVICAFLFYISITALLKKIKTPPAAPQPNTKKKK